MSKPIVSFDEQAVKDELRELVRKTTEEAINAMLDEEADQLVGAAPHERTEERAAYRAGHYERGFTTTSGQVTVKMPKLKDMRLATAVIERCKRRETSVEEAIIDVPGRRAHAPHRGRRRDPVGRGRLRRHGRLDRRGVPEGQIPALHGAFLPQRPCQDPQIQALPGRGHAQGRPRDGVARGIGGEGGVGGRRARSEKLKEAAKVVREGFAETLTYCEMPREHWRRIRTNNAIERLNREIRRRTRVVGTFPNGKSALMLVAARLKYVTDSEWGSHRYLDASLLKE